MLKPEAIELLEQVKRVILEEPKRLDMNELGFTRRAGEVVSKMRSQWFPVCGTVGCIAGWAALLKFGGAGWERLKPEERDGLMTWKGGQEALGLSKPEAVRLFREPFRASEEGGWPKDLADRYVSTQDRTEKAKITAERIDLFVASGGCE